VRKSPDAAAIVTALLASGFALGTAERACSQDMSTYYTVKHPEKFEIDWTGFYKTANSATAETRANLPHRLDRRYGDDPKQQLDLYLPAERPVDAPVFLFFHGGGFQEGDRAHYGFVARPFAASGTITAVASYRLATAGFHYPAQAIDARAAVLWVHEHIEDFGGDPNRIYIGGHSAGAILAADLGVDRSWLEASGVPREVLRGIVPISGVFDLRRAGRPGYVDAYAPSPKSRRQASPALNIGNAAPSTVVAVGSLEESIVDASSDLAGRLAASGVDARLVLLPEHDHKDTVLALGDESSPLFKAILDMMNHPL
jgi:arylformamidase